MFFDKACCRIDAMYARIPIAVPSTEEGAVKAVEIAMDII